MRIRKITGILLSIIITLSFMPVYAFEGGMDENNGTELSGAGSSVDVDAPEEQGATVKIKADWQITSQPEDVTVEAGEKATFKVTASGSGLKYQWQWKSGSRDWANTTLSGYNTDTLSFTAAVAHNGRQYRCVVTDASGNTVESEGATLTVEEELSIIAQPEDITVAPGAKASFSVKAKGIGLKYQWQWKSGSRDWANTALSGYNTDTLSFTAAKAHNGRQYRCVITDAKGNKIESKGAALIIVIASGTCGNNLNWTLEIDGLLTIGGEGDMYSSYTWNGYKAVIDTVIIKSGVTSIGEQAFNGCSNLKSITIPDSVTSIGNSAFYGCSSLTSVVIPEGVTIIENCAFYKCSSLTSVVIPEGVMSIGKYAFSGCSSLTSVMVPEGVTSIGSYAFSDCSSLTNMVIPEGVTSIEENVFSGCSSLTSVVTPEGVTIICSSAFYGCSSLSSIIIPDGVTSIGNSAFYGCSSLTSVEIPEGVTSMGYRAFYKCSSLTSVEIPDSVTSIGYRAFYECSSLTSVVIPEGMTSIESYIFYKCSSLTSVEIPDSVTSIGGGAFSGCSSLTSVYFGGTEAKWNTLSNRPNAKNVYFLASGPVIIAQPEAFIVLAGGKATFTVKAKGKGLKYQWQWKSGSKAWVNTTLSGYNTDTLSFTAQTAHNDRQYRCVVTDENGNMIESDTATLTVTEEMMIISQPVDVSVLEGEKATFKVAAIGNGLTYQWQWKSGNKAWANTTLSGYKTNTLSFTAQTAHNGRQYRCVIKDANGNTVESYGAKLTVEVLVEPVRIVSQPKNVTVVAGEKATFKVQATGTGLTYQWQWKSGSKAWANTSLSGCNTDTLSFTAQTVHNGRQYRCVVTDEAGNKVESEGAILTVAEAVEITAQPEDVTVAAGGKATFIVTAKGVGLTYQWQWKSGNKAWANTNLSGCNTDTLSFTASEAHNGRQYRCVVTDSGGNKAKSDGAKLTVTDELMITEEP